jgi:hypothetical protein
MKLSRRSFFAGLGAAVAAVAIVPKALLKFYPDIPPLKEVFPGWLECNGAIVPRDKYPAIYAVLGDTYGKAPEGMCRLPNLKTGCATLQVDGGDVKPFYRWFQVINANSKAELPIGYMMNWVETVNG